MKWALPRLPLLAVALAAACSTEEVHPVPSGDAAPRGGEILHTISSDLPTDMREEAQAALARDAFRREQRFLDAVKPGHLFLSTRAAEVDLEAGAFTHDEIFQLGGQLFNVTFTPDLGFGARDLPPLARVHKGRRGGPDAGRCAACHWRGGPAGGGDAADEAFFDGDGDAPASAFARNPIALAGAGWIELLAHEMTADLARTRATLAEQARATGATARGALSSKDVLFGFLTARPDGTFDSSEIRGVDADLVVKPFGWKGNVATIRDAVEDALLVHHGMQSSHLVATASKDRVGAFGGDDPDGDGVTEEIAEGQVTALTLFVAMQEVPVQITPTDSDLTLVLAEGRGLFTDLGCAACHTASLPLLGTTFTLASRGGGADVAVNLAREGAEPRLASSEETSSFRAFLYSDLKRHDLGPALAEPRADRGVAGALFLTRPLWGLARSRPYLHDGRSPTIEDAILLHGGEGQAARDAYAALPDLQRGKLRVFLTSLSRRRRLVTQ